MLVTRNEQLLPNVPQVPPMQELLPFWLKSRTARRKAFRKPDFARPVAFSWPTLIWLQRLIVLILSSLK